MDLSSAAQRVPTSKARRSPAHKPPLVLCAAVLGVVAAMCVVSALKGNHRFDQYTYYFYDNGDAGHPGLMNAVATLAFLVIAVVSALLALTLRRSPWLVNAILFVVIALDYLVRAHNRFPGGDALARLAYLAVVIYVLRRLWRVRASSATLAMLAGGFGCFLLSDLFDVLSSDPYGRGSVLEESMGCLGAWCFALAIFGFAQTSLRVAESTPPPP